MKMKKALALVAACALAAAVAAVLTARSHAASQLPGMDEQYLKTSSQGDMFEIAGGKLALKKSHNKAVRALAQRLIKDHSKSLADAKQVAQKYGVSLENKPTPSQQWELQAVSALASKGFDRWYSDLEVLDHQQDIQETSDEISMGSNADVKKLASDDLPVLKTHLKMSQTALKSAKH